jgi:hypothetical protein
MVSAYDNDPRVTACGGAGYEVTVTTPSGRTMFGRVRRTRSYSQPWESFWADGEPMFHYHDSVDEAIGSFLDAEAVLRRVAS